MSTSDKQPAIGQKAMTGAEEIHRCCSVKYGDRPVLLDICFDNFCDRLARKGFGVPQESLGEMLIEIVVFQTSALRVGTPPPVQDMAWFALALKPISETYLTEQRRRHQ